MRNNILKIVFKYLWSLILNIFNNYLVEFPFEPLELKSNFLNVFLQTDTISQ